MNFVPVQMVSELCFIVLFVQIYIYISAYVVIIVINVVKFIQCKCLSVSWMVKTRLS